MNFRKNPFFAAFPGLALALSVFVSSAAHLSAQLEWKATTIHQDLELGQATAEAEFHFENKGTYPVVIRSTSSSCGCTTAKLERSTYYPGDKGTILTHFDVGGRTGERRNTVRVLTDDPTAPSTTLTFSVDIPSLVTISPRLVHWRTGESPEEKSVHINVNPDAELEVTGIKVDQGDYKATLVKGEKPGEFEVRITPGDTKSPGRAIISLQTEPEVENRRNFSFYAYVR